MAVHKLLASGLNSDELRLEITAVVLKHEERYQKLARQIEAFNHLEEVEAGRRDR